MSKNVSVTGRCFVMMMGLGFRHLAMIVVASLLLLLFYVSLFSEPLSSLLNTSPRSPSILNMQYISPVISSSSSSSPSMGLDMSHSAADDPYVVSVLRRTYLEPPSTLPYDLSYPDILNPSMGQAQVVDALLKGMRGGFYVECGGLDGELRSNTLFFERERGWHGLVIEADPDNYAIMKTKHRRAYISPTCLATTTNPATVVFAQNSNRGHIYDVSTYDEAPAKGLVNVQCFPFLSFLLALNTTTVDYFSLDVEGAEYKVLATIPWDRVDIKTLSVEYFHDAEGKAAILKLLLSKGYVMWTEVTDPNNLANDFIFVKKDLIR